MRITPFLFILAFGLMTGCEDGPNQVFEPATPGAVPNAGGPTWTPDDVDDEGNATPARRGFGSGNAVGGDSVGRARFCDEEEAEAQIVEMVSAPIIPDVSVGSIPLLDENGQPYLADTLLGRPEDGKYCDPTEEYADAFVWGPTQEVIVFFDQETRLVDAVIAYQSYLGQLTGTVTVDGEAQTVTIQPRERIKINDVELSEYAGSADRNDQATAFLNEANVTKIYGMVRETFFGAEPLPADYNCVEAKLCRIVYTSPTQESVEQDTFIILEDSGLQMRFTPDGYVMFVYAMPVRVAPFEVETEVDLLGATGSFNPRLISNSAPDCVLDLDAEMTWADFSTNCVPGENTRARISYNVHTQRDGVTADFNATSVDFLRRTTENGVLADGEAPGADDILYGFTWTLSSSAPVTQFVPAELATGYKRALERRLRRSVAPDAEETHPFLNYEVNIPESILEQMAPAPIDALRTDDGTSWMQLVRQDIESLYSELTTSERALMDSRVLKPIYLIDPYVETVLEAFTGTGLDEDGSFLAFRSTDDERWSIGFAHFVQDGEPYRVIAQFNLGYDGVTAVTIERGYSELDDIFNAINTFVRANSDAPESPYYDISLGTTDYPVNGWGLGKPGIVVNGFDRQLGTLDVTLRSASPTGAIVSIPMTVPGTPVEDRTGYLRQLRGERYEFVPANLVQLLGKETNMSFYIKENGEIGRISQSTFKGNITLCRGGNSGPNLTIQYGDELRKVLAAWEAAVGAETYRECELVFNYSENGNVLDEVVSLRNKVSLWTLAGRASTATIWN